MSGRSSFGGKLSNASHEVSTSAPMRSGRRVTTSWQMRAAGVVADERDVVELERGDRVGDQVGHGGRGEVGVRRHRDDVRAERQVERDAAEVGAEAGDDLAPQVRVDEQAVDEDERRPAADAVVAEHALRQRELTRGAEALGAQVSMGSRPWFAPSHTDSMYLREP